jgi:hypothetical protein
MVPRAGAYPPFQWHEAAESNTSPGRTGCQFAGSSPVSPTVSIHTWWSESGIFPSSKPADLSGFELVTFRIISWYRQHVGLWWNPLYMLGLSCWPSPSQDSLFVMADTFTPRRPGVIDQHQLVPFGGSTDPRWLRFTPTVYILNKSGLLGALPRHGDVYCVLRRPDFFKMPSADDIYTDFNLSFQVHTDIFALTDASQRYRCPNS